MQLGERLAHFAATPAASAAASGINRLRNGDQGGVGWGRVARRCCLINRLAWPVNRTAFSKTLTTLHFDGAGKPPCSEPLCSTNVLILQGVPYKTRSVAQI